MAAIRPGSFPALFRWLWDIRDQKIEPWNMTSGQAAGSEALQEFLAQLNPAHPVIRGRPSGHLFQGREVPTPSMTVQVLSKVSQGIGSSQWHYNLFYYGDRG